MRSATFATLVIFVGGLGAAGWYFKDRLTALGTTQARPPTAAQAPRTVPVELAAARSAEVSATVEVIGTARSNEAVTITAKTAGFVTKIGFQEGQKIAAGTILMELDPAEMDAKFAELRAARDNARQNLTRAKALLESRTIASAKVEDFEAQLQMAEARLKVEQAKLGDLTIRAPFAGRLGLRQVSLGALVKPGDPITTLDDSSVIKLEFEVPETALSGLQRGARVTALSPATPGRIFEGLVSVVDSRVDPVTRTVQSRAIINNADDALKPGMFMTVNLITGRRPAAVVVPEEAIQIFAGQTYVFVVRDKRATRTRVVLGQRMPGLVEVLEGVAAGADVVVGGLQHVRDGSTVQPVTLPAQGKPAGTPTG